MAERRKKTTKKKRILPARTVRDLARSEDYKIAGEFEKALKVAKKILVRDPSCMEAAEEVADNYLSLDMHEEAIKAAKFAFKLNKKSYIANYVLGFSLLTAGNNEESLPFLQAANEAEANNPEILRCLGWALFHLKNEIMGIATLERALNLRSDDPLILCDLGVCLLHYNNFEKTIHLFERALALEPDNERAHECLEAAISLKDQVEKMEKQGLDIGNIDISIPHDFTG